MAVAIANPTIRVNDETVSVVPNSVTVKLGGGETNVRASSAGGNSIETVHTSNAESKIGAVNFDIFNTPEMVRKVSAWQASTGGNTIQVIGNLPNGTSISLSMQTVSLTNDPDLELSADGVTSLEFMGDPLQVG
jgi:hypothetical protein